MQASLAPPAPTPELQPAPDRSGRQVITGLCGICPAGCGVKITMEDGRISHTAPLKGHPQGMCCPRGAHFRLLRCNPTPLQPCCHNIYITPESRFVKTQFFSGPTPLTEGTL